MNSRKAFSSFLKISLKAYPGFYVIYFFKAIFTSALTIFNIYALTLILNAVTTKTLEESLITGAIVVGVNVISAFLNKLFTSLVTVGTQKMRFRIQEYMCDKMMKIPYSYLENPYYLDLKEKAKFACNNQAVIQQILNVLGDIIQIIITLVALFSIMITFDGLILAILAVSIGLTLLITIMSMKYIVNFFQELLPINRRYGYYINTLTATENAKDYRLFPNISALMRGKFTKYSDDVGKYFVRFSLKQSLYASLAKIIDALQMGAVYALVAYHTITQGLSIGSFSLYVSSAISFSTNMSLLIDQVIQINRLLEYLKPLLELLNLEEEKDQGKQIPFVGSIETIEFKNVTFTYPKTSAVILNNLSFKIEKGQKISIVGLNGAGKTTLVKLLCRFYHSDSGEILVNGVNIFDYEYHSYISNISAVFQDYKLFAFTLEENISGEEKDTAKALNCAYEVGLKDKLDKLPDGLSSRYSKEYDEKGIELSGGEAQKIAIARALYKDSSLVILDEPTSALDPLAEADIYKNFNEMVGDKTALYISHRMSSSVFCDKILVIDGGVISDFDSHKNLMKKKESLYYKLFSSQAKNYKFKKVRVNSIEE